MNLYYLILNRWNRSAVAKKIALKLSYDLETNVCYRFDKYNSLPWGMNETRCLPSNATTETLQCEVVCLLLKRQNIVTFFGIIQGRIWSHFNILKWTRIIHINVSCWILMYLFGDCSNVMVHWYLLLDMNLSFFCEKLINHKLMIDCTRNIWLVWW